MHGNKQVDKFCVINVDAGLLERDRVQKSMEDGSCKSQDLDKIKPSSADHHLQSAMPHHSQPGPASEM